MKNVIRGLWQRPLVRVFAWIALSIVIALFAAFIGWHGYVDRIGRQRWAAAQQMISQQGESLDVHTIAPEAAPDEQNFCAIPALNGMPLIPEDADDKSEQGRKRIRLIKAALPNPSPAERFGDRPGLMQGAAFGQATDLNAWAGWLRRAGPQPAPVASGNPARDILAGLSGNDALVHELAEGLNRPESQWTPAWKARPLPENPFELAVPHLEVPRALTPMLCLRCAAAARAGDAQEAQKSLLIAARLNQANLQEPYLIGTMVACRVSVFLCGAVWELCNAHAGTDEDFRMLEEALSKPDYQQSLLYAFRGELAGEESFIAYLNRKRDPEILDIALYPQESTFGDNDRLNSITWRLLPSGFFDENAATIAQWDMTYLIKPLRDSGLMQALGKAEELQGLMHQHTPDLLNHRDELLAQLAVSVIPGVIHRVIYTQSLVNEAIAACALERYRIKHNAYPDTLQAAGQPGEAGIPLDLVSGKPMGYRPTPDGRYKLWCVAFNDRDHGGKRILDPKPHETTNFSDPAYNGDWVWDFTGK